MAAGPSKGHRDPLMTSSTSDTAFLVSTDVRNGVRNSAASCEEIAFELNDSSLALNRGLHYGYGYPTNIDSPSDCTTLSTISNLTSTPLDHKYRYHLFFAYNEKDQFWVEHVVRKLEQEPLNFRCCYAARDFDQKVSSVQNVLCSIMLSQRIVVVLTPSFIQESWTLYEESITHLTSLSQRRQRVVPVVLDECIIPESLRVSQPVDVSQDAFWDGLFHSLTLDGFPYSESLHTVRSLSTQSSGFVNGQLLARVSSRIRGKFRAQLLFDYDDIPDPLTIPDIGMSHEEFVQIVQVLGREDQGKHLSWLFSVMPLLLLGIIFFLWCIAFILVILLFPDNTPSTLPIRLCVFTFPGVFIVLGCVIRWKKVKHKKEKFSLCMFSRSLHINRLLYQRGQSVLAATARTHEDHFHIYFIYFNRSDCIEEIKLLLTHCSEDDINKLNKLVEVYTLSAAYLRECPVAVRLAVMISSSYAVNLVFKRVPHSLEHRHTRRRQCLCQFVEEFLAAYLPCIRQEADVKNVCHVFFKYLNCQLKPDRVILQTLGIAPLDV